jgi:hypothetical protein
MSEESSGSSTPSNTSRDEEETEKDSRATPKQQKRKMGKVLSTEMSRSKRDEEAISNRNLARRE